MVFKQDAVFKGIAVFTPGGDLIYGIDKNKQTQWHSHLCLELQTRLGLKDSPHFLIPGYTATVEKWLVPSTQEIKTVAEVYPAVQRYIPLLQVLFNLEADTQWRVAPWQEEHCNRAVIETYRRHFPQLWRQHNLIACLNRHDALENSDDNQQNYLQTERSLNYVLHLFIASKNSTAEKTLTIVHQLLESGLTSPYTLKVIDISQNPEQAQIHQVSVTPTLIRITPQPIRRIVGQFDDIPRILKIITSF